MKRLGIACLLAMGMATGVYASGRTGTTVGQAESRDSAHAVCERQRDEFALVIFLKKLHNPFYTADDIAADEETLRNWHC